MSKFSEFLAAIGLAPKTLTAATATIGEAKGKLDSVNALFSAAGLNADTLLAAGPDALKAHIAGLSIADGELAIAQAKILELTGQLSSADTAHGTALSAKTSELATATAALGAAQGLLTAIGLDPKTALTADGAQKAFGVHVKKHANAELAKVGHPPIRDDAGTDNQGAKTMARATFTKLSPRAQLNFVKGGGTVVE